MKYTGIRAQDSLTRIWQRRSAWPRAITEPICLFWKGWEPLRPADSASPPQPSATTHEPLHQTSLIIQERMRRQGTGKLNSTLSILFLVHRFQDIEENIENYEVWGQLWIRSLTPTEHSARCAMNMHEPGTHTCIFLAQGESYHCHHCQL